MESSVKQALTFLPSHDKAVIINQFFSVHMAALMCQYIVLIQNSDYRWYCICTGVPL